MRRKAGVRSTPLPGMGPQGAQRLERNCNTSPRAAIMTRRRTADSAGSQDKQHGAIDVTWQRRHNFALRQTGHDKQCRDDAQQLVAIAVDGQSPVHELQIHFKTNWWHDRTKLREEDGYFCWVLILLGELMFLEIYVHAG